MTEPYIPAISGISGTTHHIDVILKTFDNAPGYNWESVSFNTQDLVTGTFYTCKDNGSYGYPTEYGYDSDQFLAYSYGKLYSGKMLQNELFPASPLILNDGGLRRYINVELYANQTRFPISGAPNNYYATVFSYTGEYGETLVDKKSFLVNEIPYAVNSLLPCAVTAGDKVATFNLLENGIISGASPCPNTCQDLGLLYIDPDGDCAQKCEATYGSSFCSSYDWYDHPDNYLRVCICCLQDGLPEDIGEYPLLGNDLRKYPSDDQMVDFSSDFVQYDFENANFTALDPTDYFISNPGLTSNLFEGGAPINSNDAFDQILSPLSMTTLTDATSAMTSTYDFETAPFTTLSFPITGFESDKMAGGGNITGAPEILSPLSLTTLTDATSAITSTYDFEAVDWLTLTANISAV